MHKIFFISSFLYPLFLSSFLRREWLKSVIGTQVDVHYLLTTFLMAVPLSVTTLTKYTPIESLLISITRVLLAVITVPSSGILFLGEISQLSQFIWMAFG